MFTIEMLPAKHGDAMVVSYGAKGERVRHLWIDCGPINAYPQVSPRLDAMEDDKRVELLVITHVDTDHIDGVIRLLAQPRSKWQISPDDIWFNGYRQMVPEQLGGHEGEFLSALLANRAAQNWNKAFKKKAVMVPANGPLPVIDLADGMRLTLLSPDKNKLDRMAKKWVKDLKKWSLPAGDLEKAWAQLATTKKFHLDEEVLGPEDLSGKVLQQLSGVDSSEANGSSIAFLAEFNKKSCLFLADAHMDIVCASIRRLLGDEDVLKVDAVKMAHHGSKNNFTPEFLTLVDAKHYLFSSNGDKFSHPDKATVEAVIEGSRRKPVLWFNYRSSFNEEYEQRAQEADAGFETRYPDEGEEGILVKLAP